MSKKKRFREESGEQEDVMDPCRYSPISAAYNPERDGTLEQYFEIHDGNTATAVFYGMDHFNMLMEKGWFKAGVSIIRVMWNMPRDDEYYWVTHDYQLEGIPNRHHGGKPGVHDPAELLKKSPPFEAQNLWGPAWEAKLNAQREQERVRYEQYQARKEIEQTVDNPQPPEESP